MSGVLSQEYLIKERLEVIQECLDGLRDLRTAGTLSLTVRAALEALERLSTRSKWNRLAMITASEMRRPVAIAQQALERESIPVW
ncbi:MAG: hypothetical protein V4719_02920 [Planctomycetota bacterium]